MVEFRVSGHDDRIATLVVDDDKVVRALSRVHLEVHGAFRVVGEAADGSEAVTRARQRQPELIVLDVDMPHLDGLAALPQIHRACRHAIVVMHSALGNQAVRQQAAAVGASGFLDKGLDMVDLPARLLASLDATPAGRALVSRAQPGRRPPVQRGPHTRARRAELSRAATRRGPVTP